MSFKLLLDAGRAVGGTCAPSPVVDPLLCRQCKQNSKHDHHYFPSDGVPAVKWLQSHESEHYFAPNESGQTATAALIQERCKGDLLTRLVNSGCERKRLLTAMGRKRSPRLVSALGGKRTDVS